MGSGAGWNGEAASEEKQKRPLAQHNLPCLAQQVVMTGVHISGESDSCDSSQQSRIKGLIS